MLSNIQMLYIDLFKMFSVVVDLQKIMYETIGCIYIYIVKSYRVYKIYEKD